MSSSLIAPVTYDRDAAFYARKNRLSIKISDNHCNILTYPM